MSTRRLSMITTVPFEIQKAFSVVKSPATGEESLWRERAARMTLDALGYTNLTTKPLEHNFVVGYARRWFRQLYAYHPEIDEDDNSEATFDSGGVFFDIVARTVLSTPPILLEIEDSEKFS